jgi:hypothetical protein
MSIYYVKELKEQHNKLKNEMSQLEERSSYGEEDDIRFSDKVLGDAKRMIAIILFTTIKFY